MLYEVNTSNIDNFIKIVNENIVEGKPSTHRMVMYHTRTVHPYLKLLVCTKREWLLMQQFVISSEHLKGNIDVICNVEIDTHTLSLIQHELTTRKEYLYEKNAINTTNLSRSNIDWL